MVEISLSGSGEGPGWATAPGYSTMGCRRSHPISSILVNSTGESLPPEDGDPKRANGPWMVSAPETFPAEAWP